MTLQQSIKKIFVNIQRSSSSHPKVIKNLIELYLESNFEEFFEIFVWHLKCCLIIGENNPNVERTLNFVAKFASSAKSTDDNTKEKEATDQDISEVDGDVDPFLVAIFKFMLENHDANSKAVRLRICQLINKVLNNMGEEACIDDGLYNSIYDTMLQRLMDKVPGIRVQAIHALARLQEPQNKECPVIKAYRFHLSMDPNPEVRKTALNTIAITFQTLPDILQCIRDARDVIRRQTYLILSQKVHLRSFTIAQRVMLISEGLNDRSEIVQQCVKKNLLQAWLRLANGSILELLTCLDVEASPENAELALSSLFDGVPHNILVEKFSELLNNRKIIEVSKIKPEAALYWKCLAKHLRSEGAEDALEEIIPDLSYFCQFIQDYILIEVPEEADPQETAVKIMEKDFICQHLLSMCSLFDLSDEVGRKNLGNLVRELLLTPTLGEPCIDILADIFCTLHSGSSRVNLLAEIISDLREPPTILEKSTIVSVNVTPCVALSEVDQRAKKLELAKITVKLNQLKEDLEECVRSLDFMKAQELKIQLQDLEEEHRKLSAESAKTVRASPHVNEEPQLPPDEEEPKPLDDDVTLTRCLVIANTILSKSDVGVLDSTLRSLHDNLILPSLRSEEPSLRKQAVHSLGLWCLFAKDLALLHLPLLVQICQVDIDEIKAMALKGIYDILTLYGVEEFFSSTDGDAQDVFPEVEDDNEFGSQNQDVGRIISTLSKFLDDQNSEIRTLAAEGLCKLLVTSRITSAKLLSRLILLYYNPNEEESLLRHILGVFFALYPSYGGSHQQSLCEAFIPTLQTLFKAPLKSPLASVDLDDVASFLVSTTSPAVLSKHSKEVANAHDTLVFSICAEIIAYPDRDYVRVLVKCLNQLSLSPTNFTSLKQVDFLLQKMVKKLGEQSLIKTVNKFHQTVKNYLRFAPVKEEPHEQNDESSIVTDTDNTVGSFSCGRKRTLYTTQTEMELTSDVSESEDGKDCTIVKREPPQLDSSAANSESDIEIELSKSFTPKKGRWEDTSPPKDASPPSSISSNTSTIGRMKASNKKRNTPGRLSDTEEGSVTEDDVTTPMRPSTRILKRQFQEKNSSFSKAAKAIADAGSPFKKGPQRDPPPSPPSLSSNKRKLRGSNKRVPNIIITQEDSSSSSTRSTCQNRNRRSNRNSSSTELDRNSSFSSQSSSASSVTPPIKKKLRPTKVSKNEKPEEKRMKPSCVMLTPMASPLLRSLRSLKVKGQANSTSSSQPSTPQSSSRTRPSDDQSIASSESSQYFTPRSRRGTVVSPPSSSSQNSTSSSSSRTLRAKQVGAAVSTRNSSSNDSEADSVFSSSNSSVRRSSRTNYPIEGRKSYSSK